MSRLVIYFCTLVGLFLELARAAIFPTTVVRVVNASVNWAYFTVAAGDINTTQPLIVSCTILNTNAPASAQAAVYTRPGANPTETDYLTVQALTSSTDANFTVTKGQVGSSPFLVFGIYNRNSTYSFEVETVYYTELPPVPTPPAPPTSIFDGALDGSLAPDTPVTYIVIAVIAAVLIALIVLCVWGICRIKKGKHVPSFFDKAYQRASQVAVRASVAMGVSSSPAPPAGRRYQNGQNVTAQWSEDGQWYASRVEDYDEASDHYLVTFVEYGNQEWVAPASIRN